jgi:TPR repeat protein
MRIAQNHLGFMYESGKGVTPDYARAVNWYRKAGDQGYVKTQGSLAFMYEIGHGVPQDYILAHMWLNLAASQGDDFAAEKRDAVAKLMTLEQVAEAQRLAREWKPTAAP